MNSPIKTTIEARIAHAIGLVVGIGIAVAGFLANHKGATIPATGLTVGTALATVSHWRYFRIVERTVDSAVAWEKENKDLVARLYSMAKSAAAVLLPANLENRLTNAEEDANQALKAAQTAAQSGQVDVGSIVSQVLGQLAKGVATAPVAVSPEPKQASVSVDPAPSQTEAAVPASPFQNPPVAVEPAPSV